MKKFIAATAVAAALVIPAPATAAAKAHGCKVVSVTSVQQVRDVTGVQLAPGVYGHGIQHRTATTTVTKCKGRTGSAVTYTSWA